MLALLDVSSAFDTIGHSILVHHHHNNFGFTNTVLQWFSSYLTDQTQCVFLLDYRSASDHVNSGVQFLAPILFSMQIKPFSTIIDSHSVTHHLFEDDKQLVMSALPDKISELHHSIRPCKCDIKA